MPYKDEGIDVIGNVLNDPTKQAWNPHAGAQYEPIGRFRTTAERPQQPAEEAPPLPAKEPPKNYEEALIDKWEADFPDLIGSEKYVAAEVQELAKLNPTAEPGSLLTQASVNIRAKVNAIFEAGRKSEAHDRLVLAAQNEAKVNQTANDWVSSLRNFVPKKIG